MTNTTRHIVIAALAAFALSGCGSTTGSGSPSAPGDPVTVVAPTGTTTYEAGKLAEGDLVRCEGSALSQQVPSSGIVVYNSLGIKVGRASEGSVTAVCHPGPEG